MALVGTRWHTPVPRRRLVSRPRLTTLIPQQPELLPRLLLVCAPAGFGKTTLLAQWLTQWQAAAGEEPRRVAWLALDAEDGDPRRFLTGLLGTVGLAAPGAGARAAELLENGRALDGTAVLTALIDDLGHLGGATVLALDDYHLVESAEVHGLLTFLLDHLPAGAGLALTTRADPPLPVARLRSRGELLELRAADLRFTADEATAFLNDVMGLHLDPAQVSALEGRTEGWAAGLQLAALSLRQRDDPGRFIQDFTGSHRFVLDYLVEEVLDGLDDVDRGFLLDTSVLDRLTGPLCDELTGLADGGRRLEELERANLFLVPLDDRREWYRYHHLFADALRARLTARSPDRAGGLHRAAARWHAAHGGPGEAIAHALAGEDHELGADLVEQVLPEASRLRQDRAMRHWLQALPDEVVRRRPVLGVTAGWTRLGDGDVEGAERRLQEAETVLEALPAATRAGDEQLRRLPITIAMYRAAIAQARNDIAGTAAQARRVIEIVGPDDHLARGAAFGFLGLSHWAQGDLEPAADTFGQAVQSLHAAGNLTDELGGTVVLAGIWWARGRPDRAGELHRQALRTAAEQPEVALPVTGDLHVGLAESLLERDDLAAAAEHLQQAEDLGERASLPENRHRWYVASARLARARDDLDGAAGLLEQAERLYLPGFFPDVRPLGAQRARLDLARGRTDLAEAWAQRSGTTEGVDVGTGPVGYLDEYDRLTLARLLVARRRPERALALLDPLLAEAEAKGRGGSVVEILLLQALALHADGRAEEATAALARALETAVPAGYARLFLDEGEPLQALLAEAGRRGAAPGHVARLRGTPVAAAGPVAAHDLSERELEVLRLLATELTGPQIARRLFVSVNTLRTHTKHIFTKLDVTTRAAAVRRGTELGLL